MVTIFLITGENPIFGDMANFEKIIKVGQHGIDFMLDMVLNHCSIEREWFKGLLSCGIGKQDCSIKVYQCHHLAIL